MRKTMILLCALGLASPLAGCDRDANEEMPGLRTADEQEAMKPQDEAIEERTEATEELAAERRDALEEVRDEQRGVAVEEEGVIVDEEPVDVAPARAERPGANDDVEGQGGLRGDAARRRARIEGMGEDGDDRPGELRGDAARRRARIESIANDARMEQERVAAEARAAEEQAVE